MVSEEKKKEEKIKPNEKMFLPREWGRTKKTNIYLVAGIEYLCKNKTITEKEFEKLLNEVKNR
jgi:hypothetical protein